MISARKKELTSMEDLGILTSIPEGKGALRMRAIMIERVAVTVIIANHIRTGFVSDHPKSRPE